MRTDGVYPSSYCPDLTAIMKMIKKITATVMLILKRIYITLIPTEVMIQKYFGPYP
jgi:hypothetical protein